uniref:Uncharacterized protein n=1 Tax=Arundo donax TaxID=35708 RepID=A0A0A9BIA7_ARUDO
MRWSQVHHVTPFEAKPATRLIPEPLSHNRLLTKHEVVHRNLRVVREHHICTDGTIVGAVHPVEIHVPLVKPQRGCS